MTTAGPDRRPNVLYVVWDDAGLAAWDVFGGLIKTPSLMRLAARGLRYSQWHTAGSPARTRVCLLTGRDRSIRGQPGPGPGGPGVRWDAEDIPPDAATLAEMLAPSGYRTYYAGRWQLSASQASGAPAARRASWPLARGFDRYFGFFGAQVGQWYPDLVRDNQHIDPAYPPAEGYRLNKDLIDTAMEFIREGLRSDPARSWLCYLSLGANGPPQAGPRDWTARYSGAFDMGYDRYREIVLRRMNRLGLRPGLAGPVPPARPWRSLSDRQKRRSASLAESYAGLCSYTDHQVGRLLDYLSGSDQLHNTIVVICSAGAVTRGQHAAGWMRAFGMPCDRAGWRPGGPGRPGPLIISWPAGITEAGGGTRAGAHRAVDVVPTILDCADAALPPAVNGHARAPLDGVSMRWTFTAARARQPHAPAV